jgi:hypothetical protein
MGIALLAESRSRTFALPITVSELGQLDRVVCTLQADSVGLIADEPAQPGLRPQEWAAVHVDDLLDQTEQK